MMDPALENRRFVLYFQIAVLIFASIIAVLGQNLISLILLWIFSGIVIVLSAHMFAVWGANLAHYGPRTMFSYRRMLRRFHNPANNRVMNTILSFSLFAVFLAIVSVFFFYIIFISIPIVVLVSAAWLRAGVPPFVLLLGATGSGSFTLSRRVMAVISPLTLAEFLDNDAIDQEVKDRSQYEIGRYRSDVFVTDTFFPSARIVIDDNSWQEAVKRYCFVAHVIVFDLRKRSVHTDFEIQVINTHNLWYKVMVIGDGNNWLFRQPWYMTNVVGTAKLIPQHDDGLLVANFIGQIVSGSRTVDPENPIARLRLAT
jgi:hypothetical protein